MEKINNKVTDTRHHLQAHTLTICEAAASGGIPRQHSNAVSALKASQTPSLDTTSLPPLEESYRRKHYNVMV